MRVIILSVILILSCFTIRAQEKCATVPYMETLMQQKGIPEKKENFEQWLQEKIQQRKTATNLRTAAFTYKVPVVVHVIHNGQAEGVGSNISDAQILSQINILNKDYQRLNSDAVNTPSSFLPVAGSMDIQFVLAKSDPDGLPTTGIVRVNGGKAAWSVSEDVQLKAKSFWPSENYINIWVTDLGNNYLGYAQFPFSTLDGLTEFQSEAIASTDGLVIDYTVFGLTSDPKYNLGRTTTHEMGHFFGLRHIWGDESSCAGTDYVSDTPNQGDASLNYCPTPSTIKTDGCAGSNGAMYQNYMDYTNDACMNLFTKEQVNRMISVLTNSPRRASLLNSPGLVALSGLGEDLKISSIISPSPVSCSAAEIKFTIQNVGSPDINSFEVNYTINNVFNTLAFPNTNFPEVLLHSGADTTVTIPVTLAEGLNEIEIEVVNPNGFADTQPDNSDIIINSMISDSKDFIPLRETFDDSAWITFNPTGGMLWQEINTNYQTSAYFNAFNNSIIGDQSWLVSPVLDFSSAKEASLLFDYSYRYNFYINPNNGETIYLSDNFKVLASENCGNSFDQLLFEKAGKNLVNNPSQTEWFPGNESEWKTNPTIDLSNLAGKSNIRIAFLIENQNGNNLFIDNIEFFVSKNPILFASQNKVYSIYWVEDEEDPSKVAADITFNLPEREQVGFEVLDTMGKSIYQTTIPNALNQTMHIPTGLATKGLYFIRLKIGSRYQVTKVYLSP